MGWEMEERLFFRQDSHGGCRGDVLRQTVPDTSSGDRKTTVDSRVQLTISDEDELERSRLMTLIDETKFLTFLSVCYTNIRTNSTYYLQHTTDWTELNVLLYDGTHVFTGLLLCVWLRLTTLNKRI